MKVQNMIGKNGRAIPNQFIIENCNITIDNKSLTGEMFQSYNNNIAFTNGNNITLLDKTYWDYSTTTGKYRNIFLNESKAETQKKIDSGEYKLVNLNN